MTRPRLTTTAVAAFLVVALVAGAAVPATATHDDDESTTLGEALEPASNTLGYVEGFIGGTLSRASYVVSGPEENATTNRDAAVDAFNQHNESFVDYANNRSIHQGEVVQVDCTVEGETATAFIVADYNNSTSQYDSATAVTSTDRAVDHEVVLEESACDNAAAEIETFHDDFASENRDITRKYAAEMASKYRGDVKEPFTGGDD